MGYREKEGISSGKITKGVQPDRLRSKIIEFIYQQLPAWRDHPNRPHGDSEKQLNPSLCKHLNIASRSGFPVVYFHHEESQGGHRAVDLSALPMEKLTINAVMYTQFDPILVVECKRLPAPSKNREKEYVTGEDIQSGGIQRFKLGLHGSQLDLAVMVGYIQKDGESVHQKNINRWIQLLAAGQLKDDCEWSDDELLESIEGVKDSGVFKYRSRHGRSRGDIITIYHLWIRMN